MRASAALHTDNIIHTVSPTAVHIYRAQIHTATTTASSSSSAHACTPFFWLAFSRSPSPAFFSPPACCMKKKSESWTLKWQRAPGRGLE